MTNEQNQIRAVVRAILNDSKFKLGFEDLSPELIQKASELFDSATIMARSHVFSKAPKVLFWQPIETAPKDGTEILVCGGYDQYGQTVVHWGYSDLFNCEPKQWIYGRCHGEYNDYDTIDNPTHWMALPELPPNRTDDNRRTA